jgi:putative membrane protein
MLAHLDFGNAWFHETGWTFDLGLWLLVLLATWAYARGRRRLRAEGAAGPSWRAAMYYGGLGVTVFALQSPFDTLGDLILSVHMVQHMLLLVVAAPLLAAATPWPELSRVLPPEDRAWLDRVGRAADGTGLLGSVARILWHPATAVVLFAGTLWLWHLPRFYDLAVRHPFIHEQEHLLYLATGVLFWSHVLGNSWLAARMPLAQRVVYLVVGMFSCWILGMVLIMAQAPLYPTYVATVASVSSLSPMTDQHLAAGLMWVGGMVPFNVAVALGILRLLNAEEQAALAEAAR